MSGQVLLTFAELRGKNVERCKQSFRACEDWNLADWATAMSGECGEACNLIKKRRRGEDVPDSAIADELADLVTYVDLLAAELGVSLGGAVVKKFNEVSRRVGSDVFLATQDPKALKGGGDDEWRTEMPRGGGHDILIPSSITGITANRKQKGRR